MDSRKTILLTTAFLILSQAAAAEDLQTHFFEQSVEAPPGENTTLGELQVTADETSVENLETIFDPAFDFSLDPETRSELGEGESYNVTVQASPSADEEPGNFTEEIRVESTDHESTEEISFSVPSVNNWTINETSVAEELVTGDSGSLTTLEVEQEGNVPDDIDIETVGNVSGLLQVRSSIQAVPGIPSEFAAVYDIPEEQEPGNYTGSIQLNGTNQSTSVDVSLDIRDESPPEITDTVFDDVEATQSTEFQLEAEDNVGVEEVVGKVYRVNESGNQSEDELVDQFFFDRESGDTYSYNLRETDETGNYTVNATAVDTSGNNQTVSEEFQVLPLDAVHVWDYNFNIGEVVQGEEKNHTVLELESETDDIEVVWDNIVPGSAEVSIGLLHEDWEQTRYFNEPGDSIALQEQGNYSVVATTDHGENITEFNADLMLQLPEQHVEEEDIIFGGRAVQNYAEPVEFSEAGLQGEMFYSEFEDGVPVTKAVYVEGDASDCRGEQVMTQCIEGLDLGTVSELSETNQQLSTSVWTWRYTTVFLGLFAIVVWVGGRRVRRNAGLLRTQRMIQYNNVESSPFFDDEETEEKPENSQLNIFDN